MAKRENETFSIKDLIPQMLQKNKLQKGLNQMDVKEAWENVMGKGVMNYTESVYLKNNTIIVKLSSSTLREELNYGKEKIIIMLNEVLSNVIIKSIRLV
jgi:hypothetical protein